MSVYPSTVSTSITVPCAHIAFWPTTRPVPCAHIAFWPTTRPVPCAHIAFWPTTRCLILFICITMFELAWRRPSWGFLFVVGFVVVVVVGFFFYISLSPFVFLCCCNLYSSLSNLGFSYEDFNFSLIFLNSHPAYQLIPDVDR